ncbi:MAG: c-type cytochrome [Natronohydrobacter sp.]|nr:c-type cytochrome [Natronohydrobacter sp.]
MRRVLLGFAALGVIVAGTAWALSAPRPLDDATIATLQGDADAGQTIFLAAGCSSCHRGEARDSDPLILSGGRSFASDFGTFRAPNISPDPDHGIGTWSQSEFINAVMRGISPQGAHYYPAFPYTSYIRADPQDIADLYAYMMTLPSDATPSQPHDLGFPFNIRRTVGLWKTLFLNDDWAVTGDLTPEETRGRYLSEALAHCAECHTPRNALGALDTAQWHMGAPNPSGTGRIPAIAGPGFDWTEFDVSAYLSSGLTPQFDVVGGSMADVVGNLRQLDKADLDAIAAYILRAAR